MGCPREVAALEVIGAVGDRSPPSEGVRVGVGMEGGISSRSNSRDKFDATGGLAEFLVADVFESLSSSSPDELEDDVSDDGFAVGLDESFATGFFFASTFLGAAATSSSDSLEDSEEEEEEELESGLESILWSPPFTLSCSSSLS